MTIARGFAARRFALACASAVASLGVMFASSASAQSITDFPPPMRVGEVLAVTQNGCGVIGSAQTAPAGFVADMWRAETSAQIWTGACVDGLVSGWGAMRRAAEASMPDPMQYAGEYVQGRATGRAGQREPGTNAAIETYTVNGKVAKLASYQGSPPLVRWGFTEFIFPPQGVLKPPKEEITRITAPDGSSVSTLKAFCNTNEDKVPACRGLPNNVIYGVSVEPVGAPPQVVWCPNPFSADNCQAVWEQASTTVRAAATAQMAEQAGYAQRLAAELSGPMADWKARRGGGAVAAAPGAPVPGSYAAAVPAVGAGTVPGAIPLQTPVPAAPPAPVVDDNALFAQAAVHDSQNNAKLAIDTRQMLLDKFPNSPLAPVVKVALEEGKKKLAAEEAERNKRAAYDAERAALIRTCQNTAANLEPSNVQEACTRMILSGYEDKLQLALAYQFRAGSKMAAKDYAAAIVDYDEVIKTNPDLADAYANRGAAYIFAGDTAKALADLDKAVALGPVQVWYYLNRGMALRMSNNPEKALVDLDKALAMEPGSLGALRERAAIYLSQQNWTKAADDYTTVIAKANDDLSSLINRASAYYNLKSFPLAIVDLDKAISVDSSSVAAYLNRGNTRWMLNDLEGALRDYDQVLKLDPENSGAKTNRANVQSSLAAKQ